MPSSESGAPSLSRKPVPHVALLPKNRQAFHQALMAFENPVSSREEASNLLSSVLKLRLETANRMLDSLLGFGFLVSEGHGVGLSPESAEYVTQTDREEAFSQLVRRCLSKRTEWESFIADLAELLSSKKILAPTEILKGLQTRFGYATDSGSRSYLRYLSDGLKLLEYANLLAREPHGFRLSGEVTPELRRELSRLRTRVLGILQKAERRRVSERTMRNLYNLTLRVYLAGTRRTPRGALTAIERQVARIEATELRKKKVRRSAAGSATPWTLAGIPYPWQVEALESWMSGRKGIAKVVTGAGKTRLALMIMEQLYREDHSVRVSIVVPTIVLMRQWADFLENELHVPPDEVGLRGGGYKDSHRMGFPVVVYVINSAIESDFIKGDTEGLTEHLLVVDECHRAGAEKFRRIFDSSYEWSLGLSATPERERDKAYEQVLVPRLGPILHTLSYDDARRQGIIPDFDIQNLAVGLTPRERETYDSLTRDISDLLRELKGRYYYLIRDEEPLERSLRSIQKSHPGDRAISLYFQKTMARKRDVLYASTNRYLCVRSLLECLRDTDKTIIFHESIDRVNELFNDLGRHDVVVYHSGLPDSLLAIGLSLYRRGVMKHLLSVKALIEGVDIPSTNVGIIMASSASTTQRVQSLGRILRNAPGKTHTQLYTVYVKDTTDERIFTKADWSKIVGVASMNFRFWSRFGEVEIEPPEARREHRRASQSAESIRLEVGAEYPTRIEGSVVGLDSKGLIFVPAPAGSRRYLETPLPTLRKWLVKYKPQGGRFIVTDAGEIVTRARTAAGIRRLLVGLVADLPNDERLLLRNVMSGARSR